jgi:hypothetical protein
MTEPWESRTDDELADNAQSGLQGQGAVVEAMRRLRGSNEKLTHWLIGLTVVLIVLTVVLVVEGATPPGNLPSGVQSPSGGSVIPVLALVVTILVAFVAPTVTLRVARQRIDVEAREAWMRAFREQVAEFLTSVMRRARTEGGTPAATVEIRSATLSYHVATLLIAEKAPKAPQYDEFDQLMNRLLRVSTDRAAGDPTPPEFGEVHNAAASILRGERAHIEANARSWWSQFVA